MLSPNGRFVAFAINASYERKDKEPNENEISIVICEILLDMVAREISLKEIRRIPDIRKFGITTDMYGISSPSDYSYAFFMTDDTDFIVIKKYYDTDETIKYLYFKYGSWHMVDIKSMVSGKLGRD